MKKMKNRPLASIGIFVMAFSLIAPAYVKAEDNEVPKVTIEEPTNGLIEVRGPTEADSWSYISVQANEDYVIKKILVSEEKAVLYGMGAKPDGTEYKFKFMPKEDSKVSAEFTADLEELKDEIIPQAYRPTKNVKDIRTRSSRVAARIEAGSLVNYYLGNQVNYDNWFTNEMFINDRFAFCARPNQYAPPTGAYQVDFVWSNKDTASKAMYNLYGGEGYEANGYKAWMESFGWGVGEQIGFSHVIMCAVGNNQGIMGDPNFDASQLSASVFTGVTAANKNRCLEVLRHIISSGDAPEGFQAFMITRDTSYQAVFGSAYMPRGKIKLKKVSANREMTDNNSCYSLAGAQYVVRKEGETEVVATLVIDENGYSEVEVTPGIYEVKETQAPIGYGVDPNTYKVSVPSGGEAIVNVTQVEEVPQNNPIQIWALKKDKETELNRAQGAAVLEDTHFQVKYYKGHFDSDPSKEGKTCERSWIIRTDSKGQAKLGAEYLVSGSDFYLDSKGNPTLPLGTVTVEEIKASKGYLLTDKEVHIRKVTAQGTIEKVSTYDYPILKNYPIRGDLKFVKIEDGTGKRMANIPFSITSKTTGESHVIVTDKNGNASTESGWNKHSENTNRGESEKDGIWFGNLEAINEEVGALLFDTYVIDELPCENNKGKVLLTGIEVVIERNLVAVEMGTLTNDEEQKPEIGTTLTTEDGGKVVVADGVIKLKDVVRYSGMEKNIGEELRAEGILTANGKPVLVEEKELTGSTKFKPEQDKGSVEVWFEFDASKLNSEELKKLTAFETVLDKEDKIIAEHKDPEDEGQTVELVKQEEPEEPEEIESPKTPEVPKEEQVIPKTGLTSKRNLFIGLGILMLILAGVTGVYQKRKKVNRK
ncbi:SpaA isopeptide-forming pilin-related protein [Ohessyouella blattaphilus]|uniref:SpaA isopeptide-forming pilin-related protein n=1 Tax=Ohessyouella blattaphilus TaxID=2949333 RepID=A0ABT1EKS8_9FIRM|nr:SpaA isopeptide-forming pilin-related protein [Ohessyouella blattaphilus]MCP1110266.1 SpaA isopeptide-forming pilin-related protein [Ohessyouella blattaphilus]MCR8563660.1 SpaA isopeptide-forming pilin-related protein [Ohessyouella blattaphilus]